MLEIHSIYARAWLSTKWDDRGDDERGMTTETVIITAILAALAIAVGAIIWAAVVNKADGGAACIQTNTVNPTSC
jgi:hypothetical protein